ncbi:hypothetical protein ASG51_03245 [Methylobacterium sp. Leaf465]|uniref:hypothetical protein n=1 Tax=Methylobacterium sp. Leaf465 TaxID=1736385 RepID=UPI0006F729B3|nr:hypothetical protein [Methylobacterium sp. Leaf465]KQT79676.1 hypothetical protein ASG51_03245 [Methylobacterium sp. Leaf465]
MNWMTWLVGRCVDLTERVVPGLERREPGRPGAPPALRGRVRGSGSEPAVMQPGGGPRPD